MKKILKMAALAGVGLLALASCGNPNAESKPEHTHTAVGSWKKDTAQHYHECECGEIFDEAIHTYAEWVAGEGKRTKSCTVCGFTYTEHYNTYKLTGSMNGWNPENPDAPVTTLDAVNLVATLTVEIEANSEFKLTTNGAWDNAINAAKTNPADYLDLTGDNIKVLETGTYELSYDYQNQKLTITKK